MDNVEECGEHEREGRGEWEPLNETMDMSTLTIHTALAVAHEWL